MVSMLVMALHTAYLWVWWQGQWSAGDQLLLALAAYVTYGINAAQYIRKLRMARLQKPATQALHPSSPQVSV
jgi:3-vinyl bacteriochlorophyllide hydratase